jgi:hypothetical protein
VSKIVMPETTEASVTTVSNWRNII